MSRTYDELLADYHELQRSFLDICQKYAADVEAARQQGRDEGSAWPADTEYAYGQPVEKFIGEAQWEGVIVSAYHTTAGKLRYVVEVKPQGFQMIAVPSQLRAALRKSQGERT